MESAVVTSLFFGATILTLLVGLLWLALNVIASWRIFTKAGEAGWKCLIPFYSQYTMLKITWSTKIFWIWLALVIASSIFLNFGDALIWLVKLFNAAVMIIGITGFYKLSRAFGHGAGFAVGLFFLNPIFMMILGFNSDSYQGPQ